MTRLALLILAILPAAAALAAYGAGDAVRLTAAGRAQVPTTYPTGTVAKDPDVLSDAVWVKFKGDRFYTPVPVYCLEPDAGERPVVAPIDAARLLVDASRDGWRAFRFPAGVATADNAALWLYVFGDVETINALGVVAYYRAPAEQRGKISEAMQVLTVAAANRPTTRPVIIVTPRVVP